MVGNMIHYTYIEIFFIWVFFNFHMGGCYLMLDKLFQLSERGTTVKTEILAGITTFITMAYILFLAPNILSLAGMDKDAVL